MKKVVTTLIFIAIVFNSCTERRYPFAKKRKVESNYFGVTVTNYYGWLADTNLRSTKKWIKRQKRYSTRYISGISFRDSVKEDLYSLWHSDKLTSVTPSDTGYLFVKRCSSTTNSKICYLNSTSSDTTIISEPYLPDNATIKKLYPDITKNYIALVYTKPDSRYLSIGIVNRNSKSELPETITNVTSDKVVWYKSGFFYSATNRNNRCNVFYHKLYKNQRSDRQFSPADNSDGLTFIADIVQDNKYLIIYGGKQNSKNSLYIKNLEQDSPIFCLTEDNRFFYKVIGAENDQLFVLTDYNSNNRYIVKIDLTEATITEWQRVISTDKYIIKDAAITCGHIVLNTIDNGIGCVKLFDTSGGYITSVLPEITGTITALKSETDNNYIYYLLESYIQPKSLYRLDLKNLTNTLIYTPDVNFSKVKYEVTPLPVKTDKGNVTLLLIHKRAIKYGVDLPVILQPISGKYLDNIHKFDNRIIYWIKKSGVYAVAAINADIDNPENTTKWINSVNYSVDCLAASIELLHEKNISNEKTLALYAENNETLITCNVINNFSEQFAVVTLKNGLFGNNSIIKQIAVNEINSQYGNRSDSAVLKQLISVTPQFNTSDNITFPATCITTTSDKYKNGTYCYIAKIQGMKRSSVPKIMINYNHNNSTKSSLKNQQIEEATDFFSFVHKNFKSKP